MKYIRIVSDTHLEGFVGQSPKFLADSFIQPDERDCESLLVLAGDISSDKEQLVAFIEQTVSRFEKVLFIPGNHEFYRHNIDKWQASMREVFAEQLPSVMFAPMGIDSAVYDGVRFAFGTMWGDGGPNIKDQMMTSNCLNDFRLISKSDVVQRFTVFDMMEEHRLAKEEIEAVLASPFGGKTVVVTHHLPSRTLVAKRFLSRDGSDGSNGGFVGACDDLIEQYAPALWIHGHTHCRIDTKLFDTRIVCNPTGYRGEWGLSDAGGKLVFVNVDSL